jgi:Icc-related predicted phosphoesterase
VLVRVCMISDTHERHHGIEFDQNFDLLLHAGDAFGVLPVIYDREGAPKPLPKLKDFDDWAGEIMLSPEQKVMIAGNHDHAFETLPQWAVAHVKNWTYLCDTEHEVLGLKIYGTPWSPAFYPQHWVFNQYDYQAEERWAEIPDDTDILIVHGPPKGYGDWVPDSRENVGCRKLLERIKQVKPKLVVCGHIHASRGIYVTDFGTVVVNASMCDDYNNLCQKPIYLTLDNGKT